MTAFHSLWLAALAAVLAVATVANASGLPKDVVRADVLGGWMTENGTRMAALRLTLAPGWKTYWRAPGDAGIPPLFDWSGSRNLAGVTLHWPAPDIFHDYGMRTIGYADELVLPLELRPVEAGRPIHLSADLDLGVCEMVCIPARLSFSAELAGGGAMDPVIRAALARRPVSARQADVGAVGCEITPISDGVRLDARIDMPPIGASEVALVETGDPSIWVSEPQMARSGGALHVRADLVPVPGQPMAIDRSALRFTVLGQNRAVDIRGCN